MPAWRRNGWRDREVLYLAQLEKERKRSDELLHVILPGDIVKELKETCQVQPRRYENVAVLFADIVASPPSATRASRNRSCPTCSA